MDQWVEFIGGTYQSRATTVSAQSTVNLYPELIETAGSKNQFAYYGAPGYADFADTSSYTNVTKLFTAHDGLTERLFGIGTLGRLIEIDSAGTVTNRGTINIGLSHPQIVQHGDYLVLSGNGGDVYTFQLSTNTLSASITNAMGSRLAFIDNYTVGTDQSSGTFGISNVGDPTTWDAADVATAESSPDVINEIIADHGQLYVCGANSIEIWSNTGNADFPFEPVNVDIGFGVVKGSLVQHDNALVFVGTDSRGQSAVYRLEGFTPIRISTHPIEKIINDVGPINYVRAFSYTSLGHSFYVISAISPLSGSTAISTVVYDSSTRMWHERARWTGSGVTLKGYGFLSHAFCFGRHFVTADGNTGTGADYRNAYEMLDDTYTCQISDDDSSNDNNNILRYRTANMPSNAARLFIQRLELECKTGATWNVEISTDGGATFDSAVAGAGDPPYWNRLGSGEDVVVRVSTSSEVEIAIANALIEAYAGYR